MDALRAEALRTLISRVEDRNFGGLRDRVQWSRGMKLSRMALLLVAVLAGGLAAFLVTQRDPAVTPAIAQPVTEIVQEARTQILVATQAIGVGQRLSPASIGWQDWPQGAVQSEYITVAAAPDAITNKTGAVARLEFFPGEPIREQKLSEGQGYLSAILDSGMRGVSVTVTAQSASGGFVLPNDHVDVVLTRTSDTDWDSETILRNVRVLAIDARLGETDPTGAPPEVFSNEAIATLELDPVQAEVIIAAATLGTLSLVLRSMQDFAESETIGAANQAIRMTSPFWAN